MKSPYVNITFLAREYSEQGLNSLHTEMEQRVEKILNALNLLLRIEESNMQAVTDFLVAQQAFHQRMDEAMTRVEERLQNSGSLPDIDQQGLNSLHTEMEQRVARLEAMVHQVPPTE